MQASVYELLEQHGIPRRDAPNRFDEVVQVLTAVLGTCSRVVVHRTVVEIFREYSQRLDFSYEDSLRDRLAVLKDLVVSSHILPKRLHEDSTFDTMERSEASGANGELGAMAHEYSSLYRMKKGVKT